MCEIMKKKILTIYHEVNYNILHILLYGYE